jgi:hypothetical protein
LFQSPSKANLPKSISPRFDLPRITALGRELTVEHRSVQRYRISIPTIFCWGAGSNFFEGKGVSRDVSTHGAFILTTATVPIGCEIWLRLAVPGIQEGSQGSEMHGNGRVVRAENDGFAVDAPIGFSTKSNYRKKDTYKNDESEAPGKPGCLEPAVLR